MPSFLSELKDAKQKLKAVSQHQVLNLNQVGESDTSRKTVVESGRSVKLKQGGTQFGTGIPLQAGGALDVVGHGSPDGKTVGGLTAPQLAKKLKSGGVTELAVIDLKSCYSSSFKTELQQCLSNEGIQVGEIKSYEGTIAVSRETGTVLQGEEISTVRHDGELPLTKEQVIIRELFSSAYTTNTLRRRAFTDQDRENVWLLEAEANAISFDGEINEETALNVIREMGLSIRGLHLRHVVPYSDIAGLMRIATSGTTSTQIGSDFAGAVRQKVSDLIDLIAPDQKEAWKSLLKTEDAERPGLVRTQAQRNDVQKIYRALAHSEKNLFNGGSGANMAIGNRFDASAHATAVHGGDHILSLADWYGNTMDMLGLNPQRTTKTVTFVNTTTKEVTTEEVRLIQHDLARPLKAVINDDLQDMPVVPSSSNLDK